MPIVGIALGSNLGDRLANLQQTRDLLPTVGCAPVYSTAPVGCPPGSPDFYNTVIEIESGLPPLQLLELTQSIESQLGRPGAACRTLNAPRTIDIDLLYTGTSITTPQLTLPHPRLHLRRFVLQPLSDLHPDLVVANQTASASQLLASLQSDEPPLTLVTRTW